MAERRKLFNMLLIFMLVAVCAVTTTGAQDTVSVNLREQVTLSCPLDLHSCGRLHSVKWYRGQDGRNRVAVYSDDLKVKNTEGPQGERLSIIHTPGGDVTELRLAATQITDEDLYTCEGTFIAPEDNCESVTTIQLNILVAPTKVVLADENGDTLPHNSALGPFREGAQLLLFCEAFDGRPAPKITWRQGDRNLKGSDNIAERDGVFTSRSELSLTLTREHLKAKIDCIVESPALKRMRTESVILDVQVRPTKISVTGVEHHVVQGTRVTLQCLVEGARPAANVTWYNSTKPVDENIITTQTSEMKDGTYETSSQMVFTGTRYENGQNFRCEADNVVIRNDIDKPIHDSILLDVRYPPVVKVRPLNITVNESSDILLFCEYESNPASLDHVVWLHDGKVVNVSNGRYDGGTTEHQALQIKNSSREDIGSYVCELTNNVGKGKAPHEIHVDVLYRPIVYISGPPAPIIEADNVTINLQCKVKAGNPDTLEKVIWYLDGFVLQELESCNDTIVDDDVPCANPAILQLMDVQRTFHGNYSCAGFTAAGWGDVSPPSELLVYYAPGNASIALASPHEVPVKGQSVTLTCSLKDKGRPITTRFRWMRGSQMINDVVTPSWTIDPVTLDSRSNITCYGHNEGGDGDQATMFLDVLAPPAFISTLLPYSGALYNAPSFSLSCRVECYPACKIHWLRDGEHIESNDEKYIVTESRMPAHTAAGHFESVTSTLHWNMTAWPENRLDPESDSGNYSCVSSRNEAGGPVSSTTLVAIEYPPQNVQLSESRVSVIEGQIPARVLCSAKSQPEASYVWKRHDEIVAKGNSLILNTPVNRGGDGEYVCEATNKHGTASGTTHLNVMFKPECVITQTEIEGSPALACTAIANPTEVDFSWQMKLDNETDPVFESTSHGVVSHLILDDSIESFRTYICVANNSVGVGVACERDVLGSVAWWKRWDKETIIIVVAAIIGLVLAVLIVCVLIIIICRRKRQNEKSPDKSLAANAADEEDSPGLYENLPFHGLQSAPNKLTRPSKTILRVPPTLKYTPPYSATTPTPTSTKSSSINLHNIPNGGTNHPTATGYNLIPLSNFRPNPFLTRATRSQLYNARTLTANHTFDPNEKKLTGSLPKNQKTRRKSHSFHSMRAKCASNRHKRTSVAVCEDKQYDSADTDAYAADRYQDDRYQDHTYENLTDSIQIYESSNTEPLPLPAPRCKSSNGSRSGLAASSTRDEKQAHHYANVAAGVAGADEEDVAEPPPIPQLPSLELYSKPESIDDLLYDYKIRHNNNNNNNHLAKLSREYQQQLLSTARSHQPQRPTTTTHHKRYIRQPLQKHHSFHFHTDDDELPYYRTATRTRRKHNCDRSLVDDDDARSHRSLRKSNSVTNVSGPLIFVPHAQRATRSAQQEYISNPTRGFQKTEALLTNDDYFQNFLKLRKISEASMKLYNDTNRIVYADLEKSPPRQSERPGVGGDPLRHLRRHPPTQYATLHFNEVNV